MAQRTMKTRRKELLLLLHEPRRRQIVLEKKSTTTMTATTTMSISSAVTATTSTTSMSMFIFMTMMMMALITMSMLVTVDAFQPHPHLHRKLQLQIQLQRPSSPSSSQSCYRQGCNVPIDTASRSSKRHTRLFIQFKPTNDSQTKNKETTTTGGGGGGGYRKRWYPSSLINNNEDDNNDRSLDSILESFEQESIDLAATLIQPHLYNNNNDSNYDDEDNGNKENDADAAADTDTVGGDDVLRDEKVTTTMSCVLDSATIQRIAGLVQGRFVDFCCTKEGEKILESLFLIHNSSNNEPEDEEDSSTTTNEHKFINATIALNDADDNIIRGAVIAIQSLGLLAMQYGATLSPERYERSVLHLLEPNDDIEVRNDVYGWTQDSTRRLKHKSPHDEYKIAGLQLLAALKRRRAPIGAVDLLTKIGAWTKHENLDLLRSGFPLHFSPDEEEAAAIAAAAASTDEKGAVDNKTDPDSLLQLRKDLRHQKVYTIDSASTTEIDDGLGVEEIETTHRGSGDDDDDDDKPSKSYRYWIHIADADKWAPRDSDLFQAARKRATSIYMPDGSISMFPSSVSSDVMSLKAYTDSYALSMGLELNDDGSIIDESIVICPSLVRVSYRLTYDDVDEMLEDGVGYQEEWELGKLYMAAEQRRKYRIQRGSAESFVPNQIPRYSINTYPDNKQPDNIGIKVNIQVSHNGGVNQSSVVGSLVEPTGSSPLAEQLPVSSSSTLVTEMMILAGEALGKWGMIQEKHQEEMSSSSSSPEVTKNPLRLPYRTQAKPDYRSRNREKKILMDLLEYHVGDGYCHAWYARRFFSRVQVSEDAAPHSGLGLDCYVQWTSPIRRFQDLQVHAMIKRFLRRQKVQDLLLQNDKDLPVGIDPINHLGCEMSTLTEEACRDMDDSNDSDDQVSEAATLAATIDADIDFQDRTKLLGPASFVGNKSNNYWMVEYIRRLDESDPGITLRVVVLGCINPSRRQYAIYLYDLGYESSYTSPVGLQAGDKFNVRIANARPQNGQLTFVRV